MENKGRNIEDLNDEVWIIDLGFLVDVIRHFKNPNKEQQSKNNLITHM
jgi:hypothetical protein